MKKFRIAILIDAWFPFHGGGQEHVLRITNSLSKDCTFTIYHAPQPSLPARAIWSLLVIPQVIVDHRKEKIDLIHAHAYAAGFPGKVLSMILRIPVVYTVHGSNMLDMQILEAQQRKLGGRIPWWKYRLEKWLLTGIRYDREISVSQHFRTYENVNRHIAYIPNGVDTRTFHDSQIAKKPQFTLLFVGRNEPLKGHDILDAAMESVRQKCPDIELVKITQELDRKKIIREYLSSSVYVLPSLSEGMPLTLLEAWAARLPVIVTDVGDNAKMVKDGLNGYLVPPGDIQALSQAIVKAYTNPNLAKMGEAGYNLVKKNYTWQKAAEATLKVYKEVINAAR